MEFKINKNIRLFEVSYGGQFPVEIFYQIHYQLIPSTYETEIKYKPSILDFFDNKSYEVIGRSKYVSRSRLSANSNQIIFINQEKQYMACVSFQNENNEDYCNIKIVYNGQKSTAEDIFNFGEIKKYEIPEKTCNINLISSDKGYLDAREYDVKIPEVNVGLNYGKDFLPVHKKILTKLNTRNEKGIVLLHGTPGSGKSTYLKYLTKQIPNKKVYFVPPSMAGALSEPTIIPFLMDRPNSILIIEDGENAIAKREGNGSSMGVSNILNLTEGILGDCLKIQIIATFNMEKKLIDPALLRKGRLIAEHKFDTLSIKETNQLLKHLGSSFISDKRLTLADIYNIDEEEIRVQEKTKTIGFKR